MKVRYLFVIIIFLCAIRSTVSQETIFAPIGAKWHYGISPSIFQPDEHYRTYEVTHATEIKGRLCRVVQIFEHEREDYSYKLGEEYFYIEGERVYHWLPYQQEFNLLYDFSAKIGESWETEDTYFGSGKFRIVVENVEEIYISGVLLKKLTLSYQHTLLPISFGSYIIERVGGSRNLFLYDYGGSDMDVPWLRCYSDQEITYKNPENEKDCDEIRTGLEDILCESQEVNIHIDQNTLICYSDEGFIANEIVLYDFLGRVVLSGNFINNQFDISSLQTGQYVLKIIMTSLKENIFKIAKR